MKISRRALIAAAALRLRADPLGLPVGFQVYPVREMLAKDFPGTLKQIAGMGYRTVEMCSPAGYERAGFGPLMKMSGAQIRRTIEDAGLRCESCHFNFRELKESLAERIAFARDVGMKQMILSTFGVKPDAPMKDWLDAADQLNKRLVRGICG